MEEGYKHTKKKSTQSYTAPKGIPSGTLFFVSHYMRRASKKLKLLDQTSINSQTHMSQYRQIE